ncbi:MAG: NmrA family NAD(P)-binding protein [Anaerolineales bacterium]|uniref:NmrA family NAD(P)-binding protein n=1 Tax=Candidatus Desulfolinea nitratireducens TaxID=2841698 RepID=A0A8J6NP10_9CHLR|nr:NmrA family NAD(P)-binding protein [Candidatus Desulfolinea nitratireducens]
MILITGAGGKTGRSLIKTLSNAESVCALVRHDEQVSTVKSLGAEKTVIGDMRDASVIRSAMTGTRAVYHICPNMHPEEILIGRLLIDEARKAGVEHLVYHSVYHPQTEKMGHHWAKLRVEELIFESGLPFTILQPAPYMQNLLAEWKNINETGVLRIPYSAEAELSFVHLEDLAEAAKIVLTEGGHTYSIYEIAGTPPLSHNAVAEIFTEKLNRDVRAEKEDVKTWRVRNQGLGEYAMETLIKMFAYYDQWGLPGNPRILSWLLDREPVSLDRFIENLIT